MAVRAIDANELYQIEKLLDTDIVRQDKVALNLLEQVLYDIQHVPTLTPPNDGAKDKNVPTNGPLTLEELREMDGDPVWGKSLITGKPGEWFILRVVEMSKTWFIACAGAEQGFGDKDTYGETWVAYRRPPEGEEEI